MAHFGTRIFFDPNIDEVQKTNPKKENKLNRIFFISQITSTKRTNKLFKF